MQSSKGRERRVIRAKDAAAATDAATEDPRSDPQGMPLTGNAPWGTTQGMPLTGIAPWGQRPLRSLPPRVWNGRNQAAVQRARVYLN
jgi:hypothetical protein